MLSFFIRTIVKNNLFFIIFYIVVNILIYTTYSKIDVSYDNELSVLPKILLKIPYIIRDKEKNESYQIKLQKKIIPEVFYFKIKVPKPQEVNPIKTKNINIKNFFSYGYNLIINESMLDEKNCIISPKILKYKNLNNSEVVQFGSNYKKLYMTNRLVKQNNCITMGDTNSLVINFDFYNNKKDFIKINENGLIFEKLVDKSKNFTFLSIIILFIFISFFSLLFYYLDKRINKI